MLIVSPTLAVVGAGLLELLAVLLELLLVAVVVTVGLLLLLAAAMMEITTIRPIIP